VLDVAVLGLLSEGPLHGYELRKQLADRLAGRGPSYGSLYPTLKKLRESGFVAVSDETAAQKLGGRSKVVYEVTAEGKERLAELLGEAGPSTWEDEAFGVHVAFFAQTDPATRMRVLEGRRGRLIERREGMRSSLARTAQRMDRYTAELQQHGLESVEREVRWLNELITTELRHGTPEKRTSP
jgi:DNA-binding PadR family transcriptional regulator